LQRLVEAREHVGRAVAERDVVVLRRARLQPEAELHRRAAFEHEHRVIVLVADAVMDRRDDHEGDPSLGSGDGTARVLTWSSIHLWRTRTLCGGRRLAGVIGLRRLAPLLDEVEVGGAEQAATPSSLNSLLDEAGPQVGLDAVQDRARRCYDRDPFVARDLIVGKLAVVDRVDVRHVAGDAEGGRDRDVDRCRVDVAEVVQVERRLVGQNPVLARPERGLHQLIEAGPSDDGHAVQAVVDALDHAAPRHLDQPVRIDVDLASVCRRDEPVLVERDLSSNGRGGFRTCDLSRVKRALSH
jgi:hypothetical protein